MPRYPIPKFDRHTYIAINNDIVPDSGLALASANPLLIAMGLVNGTSQINKFGAAPTIAAGATADIWDGATTYSFPATATITHIRQATNQVGTDGGAAIEVQGLDANWLQVTQTALLDATDTTTEVELTTPLLRVFRMKVNDNIVAAANIWCGATGMVAGTANAIIIAGNNQTLMAIYTVPAGKTAYMTQYYADNVPSAARQPDSVEFKLWMADRVKGYEFQLKHMRGIPLGAGGFIHDFTPYLKITEKTDIKISATVDGGAGKDGNPHSGFDLILIDD